MAFDWSKIEGYREDMTAEEKLALLDNDPTPSPDPTPNPTPNPDPTPEPKPDPKPAPKKNEKNGVVSKAAYDKVASELAAAKKQLRAKMTQDEQDEADRLAAETAMKEELETLRREKTISSYKASYLAQGYEEQLAEATAVAMADGDTETVFANMKKHSDAMEKTLRAKIIKENPTPPPGDDPDGEAKKNKEMAQLREYFGLPPVK